MAMKVVDIRQRSKAWHVWRKLGVTATSAAVIVNQNPDKTTWRLWAELVGKVMPPDLSVIPQVRIAMMLESHALAWFEERYDTTLLSLCGESSKYPVIRASFDGVTERDEPVEVKVLSDTNFFNVMEMREESFHYKLYRWQVLHQMFVSEGKKGYLVFYHARQEPIVFEIARDEVAIARMVEAELAFWELVRKGKEPVKDPLRDIFQPEGEALIEWSTLAAEMRNLEVVKRQHATELAEIDAKQKALQKSLLGLMGNNMLADCEGVRLTRYMQSGRVSWREIVMNLDPKFDEAKYPNQVSAKSERVKMTIDDEVPLSPAALSFCLSGSLADEIEFCQ